MSDREMTQNQTKIELYQHIMIFTSNCHEVGIYAQQIHSRWSHKSVTESVTALKRCEQAKNKHASSLTILGNK